MTVDEYEAALRHRLIVTGFDFDHPDPALAWEVFKGFATEPVECDGSYLFFEAADGHDQSPTGYFDFVREFRQYAEKDATYYEQVTLTFRNTLPDRLGIKPVAVFSKDFPDYPSFFRAVEGRPEFRKGLAFTRWAAELRIDGC